MAEIADRPLSELIAECGLADSCPLTALRQGDVTSAPVTHHVTTPLSVAGIHTLGQAAALTDEALLKVTGFGRRRLEALKTAVIGAGPLPSATEETSDIPEPTVRPTCYEVTCLPLDNINTHSYTIKVEYRGHGKWAVLDGPYAYDINGEADYEPRPSSREDDWLATHRFDLDTALELAKRAAPQMVINGHTVADALAFIAEREATQPSEHQATGTEQHG